MSKFGYLIKNVGLIGAAQFIPRVISFFMLPIYTSVLTAEAYGSYDLSMTVISLLAPVLTLNISNAALRYSLDSNEDIKGVFSISVQYTLGAVMMAAVVVIIACVFNLSEDIRCIVIYTCILFCLSAINLVMISVARGLDRVLDTAVSGIISAIVLAVCSLVFLLWLRLGLDGFFLSGIVGGSFQAVFLFLRLKAWRLIFINYSNPALRKAMLAYSVPMIANGLSWWVNSASDRIIIAFICGVGATGLYSAAYKIPTILSMIQGVFSSAWELSAVKEFDPNDNDGFFSKAYNLYGFVMVFSCSVIIAATHLLASFLFKGEFSDAWVYSPPLLISTVFAAAASQIAGIFTAAKDSIGLSLSTIISAVANVVLTILFASFIGLLGASIATAISFFIMWVSRLLFSRKHMSMKLNLVRDICSYILLSVQAVLVIMWRGNSYLFVVEFLIIMTICILFRVELLTIAKKLLAPVAQLIKS